MKDKPTIEDIPRWIVEGKDVAASPKAMDWLCVHLPEVVPYVRVCPYLGDDQIVAFDWPTFFEMTKPGAWNP